MDVFEELVERLLTRNGLGMVCPQFNLRDGGWNTEVDFLAFDFVREELAMVEVSAAETPTSLITKACRFSDDRVRLDHWLKNKPFRTNLPIRFLGFVWDPVWASDQCVRRVVDGEALCFVGIADVVNASAYWESRASGFPVPGRRGKLTFPTDLNRHDRS